MTEQVDFSNKKKSKKNTPLGVLFFSRFLSGPWGTGTLGPRDPKMGPGAPGVDYKSKIEILES